MNATVMVSDSLFQSRLREYVKLHSRFASESINKKMGDWMFSANAAAPRADRSGIDALPSRSWWCAFIQTVLNTTGFTLHLRRATRGAERNQQWTDPIDGKTYSEKRTIGYDRKLSGKVAGMWKDKRGRFMQRNTAFREFRMRGGIGKGAVKYQDAVRVSKAIIRRRRATVSYFKSLFLYAAQVFGKWVRRVSVSRAKDTALKTLPIARPATDDRLVASVNMSVLSKRTGGWPRGTRPNAAIDLGKKQLIVMQALNEGAAAQAEDLKRYLQRKARAAGESWRSVA